MLKKYCRILWTNVLPILLRKGNRNIALLNFHDQRVMPINHDVDSDCIFTLLNVVVKYLQNSGHHKFCHRLHWPSEDNDRHFTAFDIRCRKHCRAIIERLTTKYVAFVVFLVLIVCNHMPQYQRSFPSNRDHICTEIHLLCMYSNSMELSPVSHSKI